MNRLQSASPLMIWQSDMNLSDSFQVKEAEQFLQQVEDTNSDAIMYLTVYPMEGFDKVTDDGLQQMVEFVVKVVSSGRSMFIRYASEMNGDWFAYGQKPAAFIESWKRIVGAVRKATSNSDKVAFIWAPNKGEGYPFATLNGKSASDFSESVAMDSNNNGKFDASDDPYTPFYPGDDWVDWVGLSLYHYGDISLNNPFPDHPKKLDYVWMTNTMTLDNEVSNIIKGDSGDRPGHFNIYEMFSGTGHESKSKGGKPFFITESATTYHMSFANGSEILHSADIVEMKRSWWRQIFNPDFLAQYPQVKAFSFFEFVKFEDVTWRDFTVLGSYGNLGAPNTKWHALKQNIVLKAFQDDLKGDVGKTITWAKKTTSMRSGNKNGTSTEHSRAHAVVGSYSLGPVLLSVAILLVPFGLSL